MSLNLESRNETRFNDPLRPQYHFLPPKNWMNDPNGLIYWRGQYHLFYQHNPHAPQWGNIHWGHAVSDDLIHWRDLPVALAPTPDAPDDGGVWSGCIVNDNGVATALYTGARATDHEKQTVCIATSDDPDLCYWNKHPNNPVLDAPPAQFQGCGFRDPYVWHDGEQWLMVIGAGVKNGGEAVLLYSSEDLLNWTFINPLVVSDAQNDYVYECPNFFKLGDKWVLIVSVMPEDYVDYYVGLFWNNHFIVETHATLCESPFYAPLTFEDAIGRRILFGWLRETRSQEALRSAGWAGVMSLPIELMLLENNQLALTPVREVLNDERVGAYQQFQNVQAADLPQLVRKITGNQLKIVISDDLSKVIFIDGSIIEYFDFPHYHVWRVYDQPATLSSLAHILDLPVQRMGVWQVYAIW